MSTAGEPVIGVLGAVGGAGTSSLAAAIAACWGRGVLIDLDCCGGGLDLALGIEHVAGVRWSGLHSSGGRLDPVELLRRLPRWRGVAVLAADRAPAGEGGPADSVRAVLEAAAMVGPVVVDLGAGSANVHGATAECVGATVVVSCADLRGVAAAHAVRRLSPSATTGLVLRRGDMPAVEAAAACDLPLVASVSGIPRRRTGGRLSTARPLRRAAAAIDSWVR